MENYILEKISGNARNGSIAEIGFSAAQISRCEIEQGRKKPLLLGGSWWESERKRARDRLRAMVNCVVSLKISKP